MPDSENDVIDLTVSSDHGEEPAVSSESLAQLHVAIVTVPENRLREVLAGLVDSNLAVQRAMLAELVTVRKRKHTPTPRYETCYRCGESFDAGEDREDDECSYHPGRLEVAYEMWEDWDEDCHGPMDTKSNRREYPENFKWSCCKENGNSGGCREDEHQRKSQKRRV